jgi:hypothetical protein
MISNTLPFKIGDATLTVERKNDIHMTAAKRSFSFLLKNENESLNIYPKAPPLIKADHFATTIC